MQILEFNADGQQLEIVNNFSETKIIRGSQNYLKCKFHFSSNVDKSSKHIVVFKRGKDEYAVLLGEGNMCLVPNELSNHQIFKVRLVTVGPDYQTQTNQITVRQE